MPWWGFNSRAAWKLLVRMWILNNKTMTVWMTGIVARGIAWFFAVKLGMNSVEATTNAEMIANAIGAVVLVGFSIYSSLKGRKKLADAPRTYVR